ncbi:hypothetical protein FRB91_003393, partial [Serendipita sp. 411]
SIRINTDGISGSSVGSLLGFVLLRDLIRSGFGKLLDNSISSQWTTSKQARKHDRPNNDSA